MAASETDVDRQVRADAVAKAHKRAKLAGLVLGLNAAVHAAAMLRNVALAVVLGGGDLRSPATRAATEVLDALVQPLNVATILGVLLGAFTFIPWLKSAVVAAGSLRVEGMKYGPDDAYSFIIPVLNLWRPYQVVRELHDKLSPAFLPEPPPTASDTPEGHYRDNAARRAVGFATPDAPVALWWGLWVVHNLAGHARNQAPAIASVPALLSVSSVYALLNVLAVGAAVAAIVVVRRIDARVAERARRLG